MGRRVVYIIVEDMDDRDGTDIALKLENGAHSLQLKRVEDRIKGGGEEFTGASTNLKANTIELNGGETRTIEYPVTQEAVAKVVAQSGRDASETQPTSADNDDTIQPKPFRKRLASHFGTFTWETVKTVFRASIAALVRFLFHMLLSLPF